MALFTAEGGNYNDAIALIEKLRVAGIDSNITTGGIAIRPEPTQISTMLAACKDAGFLCRPGFSSAEESLLLDSHYDFVERVTNNARSIAKEWQE